jgi:hypothetical protein
VPAFLGTALGLQQPEELQVVPGFYVDVAQFARAIAKIGYCQAVATFGLDGFRPLVTRDVILGKYPGISQFVGSHLNLPPPPGPRGQQHMIKIFDAWFSPRLRLSVAGVRLFADSGTKEHGMPIYNVVVGAPLEKG